MKSKKEAVSIDFEPEIATYHPCFVGIRAMNLMIYDHRRDSYKNQKNGYKFKLVFKKPALAQLVTKKGVTHINIYDLDSNIQVQKKLIYISEGEEAVSISNRAYWSFYQQLRVDTTTYKTEIMALVDENRYFYVEFKSGKIYSGLRMWEEAKR